MQKGKKRLLIAGCALIAIAVMLVLYAVLIGIGVINGRERSLVIRAGTAEKIYDGEALVCEEWTLVHGELKAGHTVVPLFSGSQITPGQSENRVTVRVLDENNADVTSEYRIEYMSGTLSVYITKLHIVAADLTKNYDGTPLTPADTDWRLESGTLMEGHRLVTEMSASQTEIGICENSISAKVVDGAGNDVSKFYEIQCTSGTLRVLGIPLTLRSGDNAKVYDGLPLERGAVDVVDGALNPGHQLNCQFSEVADTVGRYANAFTVSIVDESGQDVTGLYAVATQFGSLEITARPIVIESASVKKKYNGSALIAQSTQIIQGSLVDAHTLAATVTGSQTEIGASPNFFTVDILDRNGVSVMSNYAVETVPGVLTVVEFLVDDGSSADPDPAVNSGLNGGGSMPSNTPVLNFQATVSGPIYLRLQSFGAYENFNWQISPEFPSDICPYNPLSWVGSALAQAGEPVQTLDLQWLTDSRGCLVPYFVHSALEEYADDSFISQGDKSYSMEFFSYDALNTLTNKISSIVPNPAYAEAEAAYRAYVYQHFLEVPDAALREVINRHILEAGISQLSDTLIQDVAEYIQNVAVYDLGAPDAPEGVDPIIYFLDEVKTGVCRHYAASAVMMYRALGIPARYVVGYLGQSTANELSTVTAKQAHAWVEVYLDGLGWLPVEVTGGGFDGAAGGAGGGEGGGAGEGEGGGAGGGAGGGTGGTLIEIIVQPKDVTAIYTSLPITATDWDYVEGSEKLMDGHKLICTYDGQQINPGKSPSSISTYQIIDEATGEDVTAQYDVTLKSGLIVVLPPEHNLMVKPMDVFAVYDGTLHEPTDYEIVSGELLPGHALQVESYTGSLTMVGSASTLISSCIVVDTESGEDVTYLYNLITQPGRIDVVASLIVKPVDVSGFYTGEEYRASDWEYAEESGQLLPGHELVCTYSGVQIEKGWTNSYMENVRIIETATGQDVTEWYHSIEVLPGRITVSSTVLVIKPKDVVALYTGMPISADDWEYIEGSDKLESTHELVCDYVGSQTEVGSTSSHLENIRILDSISGEDVTARYSITTESGSITVKIISLVLKPKDVSVPYTGFTATATEWELVEKSEEMWDGHVPTCGFLGSQTEVGSSASSLINVTVVDTVTGADVSAGYDIECREGLIEVVRRRVMIKPIDVVAFPTGETYTATEWEFTEDSEDFIEGHRFTFNHISGSQTELGTSQSRIEGYDIVDANNQSVMEYYDLTVLEGSITVRRVSLHIKPVDVSAVYAGVALSANDWEYVGDDESRLEPNHQLNCSYSGSQTVVGTSFSDIVASSIRVTDGGGDVTHYYDFFVEQGTITVTPIQLVIQPRAVNRTYDGNPLYASAEWDYVEGSGQLLSGHQLTCVVSGSQILPGTSESVIESVTILDGNSQDVKDRYYSVLVMPGQITVEPVSYLIIKPVNLMEMYTGQEYAPTEWEYAEGSGMLQEGHQLLCTYSGSLKYPIWPSGKYNNDDELFAASCQPTSIESYQIVDGTGADVSYQYGVSLEEGYIAIMGYEFTVEPKSEKIRYDGQLHVAEEYSLTKPSSFMGSTNWLNQFNVVVELVGSRTDYGKTTITVGNVQIFDQQGNDISPAFNVTKKTGTLHIYVDNLSFQTSSASKTYDGTPLKADNWTQIGGQILSTHTMTVEMPQLTNAGSERNIPKLYITDENGVDVTDWYVLDEAHSNIGDLTVDKRVLHITSRDATAPYEAGVALTQHEFDMDGTVADGEYIVVKITGEQYEVGYSENTIRWEDVRIYRESDGSNTTANYRISATAGILTVTPPVT